MNAQYRFVNTAGKAASDDDPLVICKPVRSDTFASGHLILRPLAVKPTQSVIKDTLVCRRIKDLPSYRMHFRLY